MNEADAKRYLPVIEYIARKYWYQGEPLEDFVQEGLIGLLEAERRFDPARGVKFSTYAVYWVRKRIGEAVRDEKRTSLQAVRFDDAAYGTPGDIDVEADEGLRMYDRLSDIAHPFHVPALEEKIVRLSFGDMKTLEEISKVLDMTPERVMQLKQRALRRMTSMHVSCPNPT